MNTLPFFPDRASTIAVNRSGGDSARGRTFDQGGSALQLSAHNPGIEEKGTGNVRDPVKIKKPLLFGKYQEREVIIVLTRRPSKLGLAAVRFKDGSGEKEVNIADITLSALADSQPA